MNQNNESILKGEGIPDFTSITPASINKNFPKLIQDLNEQLNVLEGYLEDKLKYKGRVS